MVKKVISRHFNIITHLLAKRYRTLLIALVAMILIPSFFVHSKWGNEVAFILNSVVVLLCIYSVQESKKQLYYGVTLAMIVILINQFGIFKDSATINFYLSFFVYIIFYAFVVYKLLKLIAKTNNVKVGVLYAAVIVYLLIGIIGGYLFMLIENANPGSLNNLALENITNPSKFFYFSFTTLSTLGYGDITPVAPLAQSLCILLSVTGPLYLTVLVALLVSRFEHSAIR
jgi:voltage-gated potassium channel